MATLVGLPSRLRKAPARSKLVPLRHQVVVHLGSGTRLGDEVRCRQHPTLADHAGEAGRHPVGRGQRCHQRHQVVDQLGRWARVRRLHDDPVGDHGPVGVEHRRLQPRAPDVDGQGERSDRGVPVGGAGAPPSLTAAGTVATAWPSRSSDMTPRYADPPHQTAGHDGVACANDRPTVARRRVFPRRCVPQG